MKEKYGGGHKHPRSMLWLAIVLTQTNLSKKSTLLYLSNFAKIVLFKIAASMCLNVLYGGGGGHKHLRGMLWLAVAFKKRPCSKIKEIFV